MAQTNFTPILIYKSDTASAVPSAGNLTNSANGAELAVNTADKRLFTKDSGGSVVELGTNPSSLTLPNGTANGVVYANGSKVLTTGSALTFDGTNLGLGGAAVAVGSSPVLEIYSGANNGILKFTNSTTGTTNSDGTWLYQPAGSNNFIVQNQESAGDLRLYSTAHIWGNHNYSTEYMRLTSTGLGIGTSSPGTKLHVNTTTAGYGISVAASGQTGRLYQLGIDSNSAFALYDSAAAAQRLVVDTAGNLGLGVTPSAWYYPALQLSNGSFFSRPDPGVGVAANAVSTTSGGGWKYIASAAASQYVQSAGAHQWYTAPSGTAGNAISFTQAMTLDASGNLLLGATSGSQRLTVSGRIAFSAVATDADIYGLYVSSDTSNSTTLTAAGATAICFRNNNTERARIDSSGNLLVGATSGSNKLTVSNGSSNAAAIRAENARNVSGDFAFVTSLGSNCNNTSSYHIISSTGGNDRFYVLGNGNVQNTNNSYGAISDAKLKDVIGSAPSYWDKFKQYQFVNYTLKSDEAKTKLLGLVAQQAQQVSPGVVEEAPDRDADGNDLGTTTLGVKYSVVTLQAEVVLQEAQARIESLEAIIEQLKADVAALKGQA